MENQAPEGAPVGMPLTTTQEAERLLKLFRDGNHSEIGLRGYVLNDRTARLIERLLYQGSPK